MFWFYSPLIDLYWKNPQFSVTLTDVDDTDNKPTCSVIISLIEKEHDNKSQIAIGFDVYKVGLTVRPPVYTNVLCVTCT